MHIHGSLNSYGDLDKSKSIPKTGNGKNTEWRCTTCNLTKMQKTVWERSTYCWGSSPWKRLRCGPQEVEKPLKEKREILLCLTEVIGVLEQKLNINLTRVLFICFFKNLLWLPIVPEERSYQKYQFQPAEPCPAPKLWLHSLCLELLLLHLISAIGRSLKSSKNLTSCLSQLLPFPCLFPSWQFLQSVMILISLSFFLQTVWLLLDYKLHESRHSGCLVFHNILRDSHSGQDTRCVKPILNTFQNSITYTNSSIYNLNVFTTKSGCKSLIISKGKMVYEIYLNKKEKHKVNRFVERRTPPLQALLGKVSLKTLLSISNRLCPCW